MEYGKNTERLSKAELLTATDAIRFMLGQLNSLRDDLAKAKVGEATYSDAKYLLDIAEAVEMDTHPKNEAGYTEEEELDMQSLAGLIEAILTKDERNDDEEKFYKTILGMIELLYPDEAVDDLLYQVDKLSDIGKKLMARYDVDSISEQKEVAELQDAYLDIDKKITEIFCEITGLESTSGITLKENFISIPFDNLPENITEEIELDVSYTNEGIDDLVKYLHGGHSVAIVSGVLMFRGYPVITKSQLGYVMHILEPIPEIISRLEKDRPNSE